MKLLTLTTCICWLTASISFASQLANNDSFRCRDNYKDIDPSLPLTEQLERDLTNGLWMENTDNEFVEESLLFETSGEVEWLKKAEHKTYKKERYQWTIERKDNVLNLWLNHQSGQAHCFEITPNCSGITLKADGATQHFEFNAPIENDELEALRSNLKGEWENVLSQIQLKALGNPEIPNVSLEGVRVRIRFGDNGHFTKAIISQESTSFEESGKWELSKDGQYIYLTCTNDDGASVTQAVKIKYLKYDEMVLEQPLAIIGKSYSTSKKYFFFNKI